MFSCLWCYKTLVRFDTLKSLDFRCLQMQNGESDPDFLSIIVPASFEKNKSNPAYPSCTFRDQTPIQCSQFFLYLLILKTLDDRGNEMSFYNANISKKKWWGFMTFLYNVRDPSTASKHFKTLIKKCNVNTDKILHQKGSGLYELTKHANILLYAINIVSRHEIDKPYYAYVNWFQPTIFRILSGHFQNSPALIYQSIVQLPFLIDESESNPIVNAMFTVRKKYFTELNSNMGCPCECSSHFVYKVLPYVTKVILEDGCFWLLKYPDHWISNRIRNCLDFIGNIDLKNKYMDWCRRIDVEKKELIKKQNNLLMDRMPGYLENATRMILGQLETFNAKFENHSQMMLSKFASQAEQIKELKKDIQNRSFASPSTSEHKDIVTSGTKSLGNSCRGVSTGTHIIPNYSSPMNPFQLPESNLSYTP